MQGGLVGAQQAGCAASPGDTHQRHHRTIKACILKGQRLCTALHQLQTPTAQTFKHALLVLLD